MSEPDHPEPPHIVKVDKSCRLFIPTALAHRVDWITGEDSISGWLVVGTPGRCRLLSSADVENDATARSLRARIEADMRTGGSSILEFQDETALALGLRLIQVRLAPPEPGWRLTLPRAIAAIMQIQPGESEVALWLIHGRIELWTIQTLRSALTTPITEIL